MTIGETESGRSSAALSRRLPGNSVRTSSSDMLTPNTRLMAVAQRAATAVSCSAATMSGSSNRPRNDVRPSANVLVTTSATGQTTSSARYTTATTRSR